MKRVMLVPLFITLCVAATSTAVACKLDPSASFQDDFKKQDPEWGTDKIGYYADNQFAIKPTHNQSNTYAYPSFVFKDATYCVDVKSPPDAVDPASGAGLVFWLTDYNNFYAAQVYGDGTYKVARLLNNSWQSMTPQTKFDKINTGPGAMNEVKVTTLKNLATLFINGEKAVELRAQAPKNGGTTGLWASAGDNPQESRFLDIVVNE
jgi:hypothetical protein